MTAIQILTQYTQHCVVYLPTNNISITNKHSEFLYRTSHCVTELKDDNNLFRSTKTIFYLPYRLLVSVIRLSSGHPHIKFKIGY